MTRLQVWLQHASNLLVGVTGVVYFIMKHLMVSEDPFSVVNHPWQPVFLHLHVLTAPLLVFFTGFLWARHAGPRVGNLSDPSWKTGVLLMLGFTPMAASGYLLQVSVEESWRTIWMWLHIITSVIWMGGYAVHAMRPLLAGLRR